MDPIFAKSMTSGVNPSCMKDLSDTTKSRFAYSDNDGARPNRVVEKAKKAKPTRIIDCTNMQGSGLKRSRTTGEKPERARLLVDKLNPK